MTMTIITTTITIAINIRNNGGTGTSHRSAATESYVSRVRRFRTFAAFRAASLALQSSRDAMASGRDMSKNSFLIFIWTTK